jgi:methylase of polypeptide subunit release factors
LGTGSGVQSLHLAGHVGDVVATDVNPRALALARATAGLNGLRLDLREGSLFEPVRGERFDLLVTNPPFVVSPGTGELLTYRDSGLPGDELVRRVVGSAPAYLQPGGVAHILANWVHRDDEPWQERLAEWVAPTAEGACDAWVVQRELADPAQYVELWLRDAGHDRLPDYTRRYDAWAGWFEEQRVTGIGFGWVLLHRTDRAAPSVRIEEWPYEVEQPLGREVAEWTRRTGLLAELEDERLLGTAWRLRADVRQETVGQPGAEDPEVIVLRQQRGMRRARQVDTVEAALVGASDGELEAWRIVDAVAELVGEDPTAVRSRSVGLLRELLADGFLTR